SNNGGLSWSPMNAPGNTTTPLDNVFAANVDPTSPADTATAINAQPFLRTIASNVAFDRNHRFYFAITEQDAAVATSGFVVVQGYDFTSGIPQRLTLGSDPRSTGNIVYSWLGDDPASNVTVAVDNNVPSFVDSATVAGQPNTQTDPFVQVDPANPQHLIAPIYVAWNTTY